MRKCRYLTKSEKCEMDKKKALCIRKTTPVINLDAGDTGSATCVTVCLPYHLVSRRRTKSENSDHEEGKRCLSKRSKLIFTVVSKRNSHLIYFTTLWTSSQKKHRQSGEIFDQLNGLTRALLLVSIS